MRPLVDAMTVEKPEERPTMEEVVRRFEEIRKGLSSWKLRSRVINRSDWALFGFFRFFAHWRRRVVYIVKRIPPIPTYIPKDPTTNC